MATAPVDPIALYIRIASILRGRILKGDWPAGTLVPGIDRLRAQYKVARATARQALQLLVAEGLITSERGRGSYVIYRPPPSQEIEDGLFRVFTPMGSDHRIEVLSSERPVAIPTCLLGGGNPGDSYVRIRKIHHQGGLPYGYFEVFVASDIYDRFPPGADAERKIIMLMSESAIPVATGRESLTLHGADWEEAQYLGYTMGMPIARISRTLLDSERRVIYAAINNYRGDRFHQRRQFAGYVYAEQPSQSKRESNGRAAVE
ncbi:MAG: GntR family transcriptional regulator [Lautropia sp.]